MNAGSELEALVVEKVMGWTRDRYNCYVEPNGAVRLPDEVPHYSTDIMAAWQVVEKMRDLGWHMGLNELGHRQWNCRFCPEDTSAYVFEIAVTPPLAICLAALAAMEERR